MTDTAGPTTLGSIRGGLDPRVPGVLAELEQLRSIASAAQGVATRALGMVDSIAARLEHTDGQLEQLHEQLERLGPTAPAEVGEGPTVAEVGEHVGELEGRLNLLAKVIVATNPDAAAELRRLSSGG